MLSAVNGRYYTRVTCQLTAPNVTLQDKARRTLSVALVQVSSLAAAKTPNKDHQLDDRTTFEDSKRTMRSRVNEDEKSVSEAEQG